MLGRVERHQQQTRYTCSAGTLGPVLRHWGLNVDEPTLARLIGVDPKTGATSAAVAEAARRLGFDAQVKRFASIDALKAVTDRDVPVILNVLSFTVPGQGHFVVATQVDTDTVTLMDPNAPSNWRRLSRAALDQRWLARDRTGIIVTPRRAVMLSAPQSTEIPRLRPPIRDVKPTQGWFSKRGKRLHQALDFRTREGTPVFAAAPGFVAVSKDGSPDAGNYIVIEHDGPWTGFMTRYLHLSKRLVKKGMHVEAGDEIGKSGNTGLSTAPHLHFDLGARGEMLKRVRPIVGKRVGRTVFRDYRLIPAELFIDYPLSAVEVAALRRQTETWLENTLRFLFGPRVS